MATGEDTTDVAESFRGLRPSPSDRSETASRGKPSNAAVHRQAAWIPKMSHLQLLVEGRTRKRLQKNQPDGSNSFLRANVNAAENTDQRTNGNPRRNQKAPMGARPLARSPSKA